MMRDISARFKYKAAGGGSDRGGDGGHEGGGGHEGDVVDAAAESENKPPASPNGSDGAAVHAPSRELIQEHLRRYYRESHGDHVGEPPGEQSASAPPDWRAMSARIQSDLAPYAVLKLGGFSLGDRATQLLSDVLAATTNLRTLDLGFNRLTDAGAALLAAALEKNASLESLYLSGNEIGPAGAEALATALRGNSTLRSLHLSGNNVGEDGAARLAAGLAGNSALRSLYLGTNGIGPTGMQALATALQTNRSLEELTLGQNRIGSDGLQFLAAAFATGKVRLTTLEIGKNNIDQDGALALAKALCAAPNQLQNLYFDNNPLGDGGASAFGAFLAKNAVVRVLDLSYTQMSLLGLRDLSMGLAYSASLLCLLLDGHDWASTQYMKKTGALHGVSLSAKGANNYAASCIVGAINANAKSALFKLTGVDLSLVVSAPQPSPTASSDADGPTLPPVPAQTRRYSDALSRNERVLKFLRETRQQQGQQQGQPPPAQQAQPGSGSKNKRKTTDDDAAAAAAADGIDSDADSEVAFQHPKFQKLAGNLKASSSSGSMGSGNGSGNALLGLLPPPHGNPASLTVAAVGSTPTASSGGGSASPSKTSSNRPPRVIRIPSRGSLTALPRPGSCEKRLSLKSPRYETTMEVHVRKVIADIAKLPFSAEELDTLYTYYLGGCSSAVTARRENPSGCVDVADGEPIPCPACRVSRLAKYPRTLALKTRLESTRQATDVVLLVLLRQLHYLIQAFQNVENAELTIDRILVSAHGEIVTSPPSSSPGNDRGFH